MVADWYQLSRYEHGVITGGLKTPPDDRRRPDMGGMEAG
jgi:hypothetical protein